MCPAAGTGIERARVTKTKWVCSTVSGRVIQRRGKLAYPGFTFPFTRRDNSTVAVNPPPPPMSLFLVGFFLEVQRRSSSYDAAFGTMSKTEPNLITSLYAAGLKARWSSQCFTMETNPKLYFVESLLLLLKMSLPFPSFIWSSLKHHPSFLRGGATPKPQSGQFWERWCCWKLCWVVLKAHNLLLGFIKMAQQLSEPDPPLLYLLHHRGVSEALGYILFWI